MQMIIINDIIWHIEEVDQVPYPPARPGDVGMGRCSTVALRIYMLKTLTPANFHRVLIHELSHAYIYSYGFDQVKLTQEVVCDFIAAHARQIAATASLYMESRDKESV